MVRLGVAQISGIYGTSSSVYKFIELRGFNRNSGYPFSRHAFTLGRICSASSMGKKHQDHHAWLPGVATT